MSTARQRIAPSAIHLLETPAGRFELNPSGAAHRPADRLLLVADLHLGKAERAARRGGPLLPPYDAEATIAHLEAEIAALAPATVVLLGDSFDDAAAAAALAPALWRRLRALAEGRRWIWIDGNHDAAARPPFGERAREATLGGAVMRHIAALAPPPPGALEMSGHYHPKATLALRGRRLTRRCFLASANRLILPAFGAYAGGLDARDAAFDAVLGAEARALLCDARTPLSLSRAALTSGA